MISQPPFVQEQLNTSSESHVRSNSDEATPVATLLAEVNGLAMRLKQGVRTKMEVPGELLGAEHVVLSIIERDGALTVPRIARERSTSRQNIQILVDRLASQGRIELVPNPEHKRSALVRLTDKGRTWLAAGDQGQRQTLLELRSLLSEIEIKATVSVLRKIHGLLSGKTHPLQGENTCLAPGRGGSNQEELRVVEIQSQAEEFPINLL